MSNRAALFQELLSRRTSIPLHNQELLYEGRRLVLDPNRQAKMFPKSSRDNPIMLVSRESVATVGLIFEDRTFDSTMLQTLFASFYNGMCFCLCFIVSYIHLFLYYLQCGKYKVRTKVLSLQILTPTKKKRSVMSRVSTASPPKVQPRYDLDLDASYAKVRPQTHALFSTREPWRS